MLRGWISNKRAAHHGSSRSLDSLAEPHNLEEAMRAANFILNDDLQSAEEGLKNGNSSFHKLGKGMINFLRATLGFEPEMIREAGERLGEAEATAAEDLRRAQRDHESHLSAIYGPGAEFALCGAQSQLMAAVVAVLSESLTESLKGFYKLRKAYITLDGLVDTECRFMESHLASGRATPLKASFEATRSRDASLERIPEGSHLHAPHPLPAHSKLSQVSNESEIREKEKSDDSDEDDFQDADESHDENVKLASYTGHLEMEHTTNKMNNMSIKIEPQMPSEILRSRPASAAGTPKTGDQSWSSYFSPFSPRTPINIGNRAILSLDPDDEAFANPIDVFVHSGSNLCFGILLLLISLIPPVFSKLLYVIGFRGDRDRGLRMLWQSSKFHNVNGAMAGLVLLGYYNGIAGFCDILPDPDPSVPIDSPDNIDGYPAKRLARLLEDMRSRYPNSKLWILEEARMKAAIKDLNGGIAMLNMEHHSPLKQVHALTIFERSLQLMYAHRYQECADSFEYCGTLNNWSVALYLYIAGAAHVELYRQARTNSLPKDAILHAQKATAFFSQSRTHVGKKKFMARQLPFDTFVLRKLDKWESRAKERNIPLVSAVGVSPITEMTFLWNGFKKMTPSMLQQSLALLSSNESDPQWSSEPLDEKAILAVLRSAIFRLQGQFSKAKEILRKEVLKYDRLLFKGHLKDDWTCPTANYELAVCLWKERSGRLEDDRKLVREAEEYLDKTAKWEGYDLDARIGLKVTTGLETVRAWKAGYDT